MLLDDGFIELFDIEGSPSVSPKKSPRRGSIGSVTDKPLSLRHSVQGLGFTALIADSHTRKEKYLQALALGLPCLHHQWLTDSLAQDKILPFDRYLLPAGECQYLGGAIRSRAMPSYSPIGDDASLRDVLERRPQPFKDNKVMLSMTSANRCKAYKFLALAAGAVTVQIVRSATEAKKTLDAGFVFDYVLCDDDEDKMKQILNKGGAIETGKKRKRQSGTVVDPPHAKVAGAECLVQTLILGELVDI